MVKMATINKKTRKDFNTVQEYIAYLDGYGMGLDFGIKVLKC